MNIVKINEKEYKINISWGKFVKSTKNRDKRRDKKSNPELLIDDIWNFLIRNKFGFKPLLFKSRLRNKISIKELQEADGVVAKLLAMEDRKSGN